MVEWGRELPEPFLSAGGKRRVLFYGVTIGNAFVGVMVRVATEPKKEAP